MKTLVYLHETNESLEMEKIFDYLKEHDLAHNLDIIKSPQNLDEFVAEQPKTFQQNYTKVIAYSLNAFSSLAKAVETIDKLTSASIEMHFGKYQYIFSDHVKVDHLAPFLDRASMDIAIKPSLSKWRSSNHGQNRGRPKGSKNKSFMLDRFKKEIEQYLTQGFSYKTISNLVKCHPQTLKSWLNSQSDEQAPFQSA